jgi:hypothetical protein
MNNQQQTRARIIGCPYCPRSFANDNALRQHKEAKHIPLGAQRPSSTPAPTNTNATTAARAEVLQPTPATASALSLTHLHQPNTTANSGPASGQNPPKKTTAKPRKEKKPVPAYRDHGVTRDVMLGMQDWSVCDKDCGWCGRCMESAHFI